MRTRITSTILIIAVAMAFFFRPSTSAYANSQNGVRTFPLEEDFESGNFPPTDWNVYDVDGLGMIWESSNFQNHTPGGSFSAYHGFASGAHDGWMVTPALEMPAGPCLLWKKQRGNQHRQRRSGRWRFCGNLECRKC